MSDNGDKRSDDQLDAFLDGQLSPDEMRAFEEQTRNSDIASEIQRQTRIDDSLRRLFRPSVPSVSEVDELLSGSNHTSRPSSQVTRPIWRRRRWIAALAIAGAVGWVIVAVQFRGGERPPPFFVSQPLTQIYQATVAQGFEPYYECREPDRFAYTFEQRQGIPVHLDPMPSGSRMLGLSYSGGLTRDTTVMLCRVDEQPVMVFVDRVSADQPNAATANQTDGLHIHRGQRGGLVMYEVTPFENARAMPYLRVQSHSD